LRTTVAASKESRRVAKITQNGFKSVQFRRCRGPRPKSPSTPLVLNPMDNHSPGIMPRNERGGTLSISGWSAAVLTRFWEHRRDNGRLAIKVEPASELLCAEQPGCPVAECLAFGTEEPPPLPAARSAYRGAADIMPRHWGLGIKCPVRNRHYNTYAESQHREGNGVIIEPVSVLYAHGAHESRNKRGRHCGGLAIREQAGRSKGGWCSRPNRPRDVSLS
jgi:hypothetical protein